jgi:hypothetical protein
MGDAAVGAGNLDDTVMVAAWMVLHRIENHELAQDFMPSRSGDFFALLFIAGDFAGVDENIAAFRQGISRCLLNDKELLRRFRWFVASAIRHGGGLPASNDRDEGGVAVHHVSTDAIPTEEAAPSPSIADRCSYPPLVTTAALQDPSSLKFASTKAAPRGASWVKSPAKRYIAILFAHRGALRGNSDGFVMVADPRWPIGKLLDRILDEAADLGCPRDATAFEKMGGDEESGSPARAWGLVQLPSLQWLLPTTNSTPLSSACGDIVDDKSAILVVTVPTPIVGQYTSVPLNTLLSRDNDHRQPQCDAEVSKKLKLLQMKECCVM